MAWSGSNAQIEREIKLVAQDSSRVRFSDHGNVRRNQWHFSTDDILNALRTGALDPEEPPATDVRGRLGTAMIGKALDGERIKVAVGLKEDDKGNLIVVITTFSKPKSK